MHYADEEESSTTTVLVSLLDVSKIDTYTNKYGCLTLAGHRSNCGTQ